MQDNLPLLQARELIVGYRSCPIAGPLHLDIHAGQLICLLGPNGSGKSTLLRTLAGLQPPLKGMTGIGGRVEEKPTPARLAKMISLVLTDPVRHSNLTVYSLVALGRYPWSGWLGILNETDKAMIAWAIEVAGVSSFSDRKLSTLSDGECQKVMLARALAQDTPLMMLDEPTAHLDLPSRIQLMQLLHRLAGSTNKGILISTHDLDLALQVADETWLLQSGGQFHKGTPEDLVLNGVFEAAFEKEGIRFDKTTGTFTMHRTKGRLITLAGAGAPLFWTKRALTRFGCTVTGDRGPSVPFIAISDEDGRVEWIYEKDGRIQKLMSIAELLRALDPHTHSGGPFQPSH